MADNRRTRPNRWWGSGAALGGAALATVAVIGIGVTQVDAPTRGHLLSTLVHLLDFPDSPGSDAFTIGPDTFDPVTALPLCLFGCVGGTEGWDTFPASVFAGPPLINIAGGSLDGIDVAPQDFMVYNSSGDVIGDIGTAGTIIQIAGQPSYEFTVTSSTSLDGGTPPADGTVYDIFDFNLLPSFIFPSFTNVYEGDPSGAVEDVMVLPSGQYSLASPVPLDNGASLNLESLLTQNFTTDLSPGDAFSNLVATSNDGSIGSDAFTINVPGFDYTLDPFDTSLVANSYNAVPPLATFPPLLATGGAEGFGISLVTQGFDVYNNGTLEGSVDTAQFVTNFLGLTTTQEDVTSQTPDILNGGTAADLPPVGTVFSVTNLTPWSLGPDLDEIYIANSTGAQTTLVTTSGSTTTPAFFNVDSGGTAGSATIETNPATVFTSLVGEQAPEDSLIPRPALGLGPDVAPDAFTINGLTFGPENSSLGAGYNDIAQTTGSAPLLAAYGGRADGISLGAQDFYYYTGTGADATNQGEVTTSMDIVDLLILQNASFTVTGCAALVICTDAPADGTVFDVLNLGFGINNIYEGTPSGNIFDEIVTPLGPLFDINLILPSSMDAAVDFTPADIVPPGLDVPLG